MGTCCTSNSAKDDADMQTGLIKEEQNAQKTVPKNKQKNIEKQDEKDEESDHENENQNENENENVKQNDKLEYDPVTSVHVKARSSPYVNTDINRFVLNDDQVAWKNEFENYKPTIFTHPEVLKHKIPDKSEQDIEKLNINYQFNTIDDKIDRTSHMGEYQLDTNYHNLPLNPRGRTGLCGRGWLWRWGPNHAADPIVTRWKRDENDTIVRDKKSGKQILEFISIKRADGGGWAIPGGMVDPGEQVSRTLKREFGEEAMDTYGIKTENEKKKVKKQIDDFFHNKGQEIFKGYVDDPRNTDNAWMETVAVNFHDQDGDVVGKWSLKAGDDAAKVRWMEISKNLELYASHNWLIKQTVKLHDANW